MIDIKDRRVKNNLNFVLWDACLGCTLDRENISIDACIYNVDIDITPDFRDQTISRKEDQRWVDFWWEK